MNDNRIRRVESVSMETKYVRERRKPTPDVFEDAGLATPTVEPIRSINGTDIMYNVTNSSLLGNGTSTDEIPYSTSDMLMTVMWPFVLMMLCICNARANVPSSQYHRGELFRRQAERVWAIQQVKAERQAIPTETRKLQIEESLRKMKVVSKSPKTGHCVLGDVESPKETEPEDDDVEEEKEPTSDESSTVSEVEPQPSPTPTNAHTAFPSPSVSKKADCKCPESPGRAERRPLLSQDSEDSEENFGDSQETAEVPQTNSSSAVHNHLPVYDDFEDDEDVCPICLDNFEVGDVVMFARHSRTCAHVFHEECLQQWLLEQRENECPTCRAKFIEDAGTNSTSSSSGPTDSNENSIVASTTDTNDNSIIEEGDIEEGNCSDTDVNDASIDSDNQRDCTFDLDEMGEEMGEQENATGSQDDDVDEMEQGFTYIIVKGSVQRVPS